ncbi:MAG TPA: host-nuclease inhibitor Gam family protein [Tepidisphaeraceae bacterium]
MDSKTTISQPIPPDNQAVVAVAGNSEHDIDVLKSLPERFCVQDKQSVNWVIRRIQNARRYAQEVKAWAELELARAEREERTLLFLFQRPMEAWAKEEIAKFNGRRKSISLPAGTIGYRHIAPRIVVEDEQQVIAWARRNLPSAITVVEKLVKTEINDYATQTGEMPDAGVRLDPGGDRFFIR